jgi:hypothetical protein
MDNATSRPGQERGDNKSHALTGSGGSEAQHMLRSIVPEIMSLKTTEHNAVQAGETSSTKLQLTRPPCGTVRRRRFRFPGPPHRHRECGHDRDDPARCRDDCPFDEDVRYIGIVSVPPPEEGRRKIDRNARREFEPGLAELGLIAEPPRSPLRRGPRREQHDSQDDGNMIPEYFGGGRGIGRSNDCAPADKLSCRS